MVSPFDPPSPRRNALLEVLAQRLRERRRNAPDNPFLGLFAPAPGPEISLGLLGDALEEMSQPEVRNRLISLLSEGSSATTGRNALRDMMHQREVGRRLEDAAVHSAFALASADESFGLAAGARTPGRGATLLTGAHRPSPAATILSDLFERERRVRRVFFSFHYQRDIWRVQQVRNHWIAKQDRESAGYFDGSLSEKARTEGAMAVKRLINSRLNGSSVTCVLVGNQTWGRRWVRYEIFKSLEQGMGLFAVRIHALGNRDSTTDLAGLNPFDHVALGPSPHSPGKLSPMQLNGHNWVRSLDTELVPASAHPLLPGDRAVRLSDLFPIYDWVWDNGNENFADWVHAAATAAGRR